ncbi:MAG: O-antigen ligase family protein [Francisella sp.]
MKQNVFTKLSLIFGVVIFISVFLLARALISIAFISIIVLFFINLIINRDFSFSELKLKRYTPLLFLLLAGVVINSGYLYNYIVYGNAIPLKTVFSISNPIIIVIYTFSLCYFLSQDKKSADYLLYVYLLLAVMFSLLCFVLFCLIKFLYNNSILDVTNSGLRGDLYDIFGNSDLQGIISFTFPLVSLYFLNLVFKANYIKKRFYYLLFFILVIFTGLFINSGKIGYINFLVLFVYCIFIILKRIGVNGNIWNVTIILLLSLIVSLFLLYKTSGIFHLQVSEFFNSVENFYDAKKETKEAATRILYKTSTGQRIIYYTSSLEIFKEYPIIFFGGCSFSGNSYDVVDCAQELINSSKALQDNPMVIKDAPLMPHNEFINYTFKGGITASIFLLIFFIYLFYITKYLPNHYRLEGRLLILFYFIASIFDYFLTLQYDVIVFFTLLALFLSKIENKKSDN